MNINDSDSFRLGSFEDSAEVAPAEDADLFELQLKKIKRRTRWLIFLLAVVFGLVFAVGYMDLKNRFSMQSDSGIREIENISAVFEDRLNELQKRIDDLGNAMAQDMAALDQKTVVSQKDLSTLRQALDKLDVSGTVKKEQEAVLKEVRKELAPLEQRLKSLQAEVTELEKKLRAQMAPLSESMASNAQKLEALQSRIGPMAGEIVSRDLLDLELLKIRKAYRQSLTEEIAEVDKQVRLLVEKVERLERRGATGLPSSVPPAQPGSAGPTSGGGGGIQEQPLP